MSSLASSPAALGLSIEIGGLVFSGGSGTGSGGSGQGSTGSGGSGAGLRPTWGLDIGSPGDDLSRHSSVISPQSMVRASLEAGGGASQRGQSVATDSAGDAYLMGELKGSFSLGDKMLTAVGGYDIFVAKYDLATLLK